MELELYYFEECPYCVKVLRKIDELGIKNQITYKNIRKDPEFREELIELSGNKKVPTLVIDGEPMKESDDINAFLEREFPRIKAKAS